MRAEVKASAKAFGKVPALANARLDRPTAVKLKVGLRALRSAARRTDRLRRGAHGKRALARVVRAERLVGASADASAGLLATVVGDADAAVQLDVAQAISSLLTIHQQVIDGLAATLQEATGAVAVLATNAIAELSGTAQIVLNAISTVLTSAVDVSAQALGVLNSALELATHALSTSLAILQTLTGEASGAVQVSVTAALGLVTSVLTQTQATLQSLVGTLAGVATDAVGAIVLPTLSGLLGSLSLTLSGEASAG
ncbi:MAG: hypothetical protein ACRDLS_14365 [Solirubrobacteraceae bacterium]